ncbi:MAG TPA: membrane protein insertion efficiency factor YidD [Flavobacteriales bacterium]|nr:membrane protein insertion efficiency factor YidD [Flavobacteriales bacterium]HRJ38769.1 membrane protein insertion efficiency factor YidD [Flavobacteriales bacterium]
MKYIFIGLVRFYQLTISPLTGASCRHQPTCSAFTIDAIKEWGALRGGWMGMKRILRCHPWGTHGHDPVPKREKGQWKF